MSWKDQTKIRRRASLEQEQPPKVGSETEKVVHGKNSRDDCPHSTGRKKNSNRDNDKERKELERKERAKDTRRGRYKDADVHRDRNEARNKGRDRDKEGHHAEVGRGNATKKKSKDCKQSHPEDRNKQHVRDSSHRQSIQRQQGEKSAKNSFTSDQDPKKSSASRLDQCDFLPDNIPLTKSPVPKFTLKFSRKESQDPIVPDLPFSKEETGGRSSQDSGEHAPKQMAAENKKDSTETEQSAPKRSNTSKRTKPEAKEESKPSSTHTSSKDQRKSQQRSSMNVGNPKMDFSHLWEAHTKKQTAIEGEEPDSKIHPDAKANDRVKKQFHRAK